LTTGEVGLANALPLGLLTWPVAIPFFRSGKNPVGVVPGLALRSRDGGYSESGEGGTRDGEGTPESCGERGWC